MDCVWLYCKTISRTVEKFQLLKAMCLILFEQTCFTHHFNVKKKSDFLSGQKELWSSSFPPRRIPFTTYQCEALIMQCQNANNFSLYKYCFMEKTFTFKFKLTITKTWPAGFRLIMFSQPPLKA